MTANEIIGNEPAFPMVNELGMVHAPGLTIRQYFAGLAMNGMLANSDLLRHGSKKHSSDKTIFPSYAEDAVKMADALIAELNKTQPQ